MEALVAVSVLGEVVGAFVELIVEGAIIDGAASIKRHFGWLGCFVVTAIPALILGVAVAAYLNSS